MKETPPVETSVLLGRVKEEVQIRQELQQELIAALRTQRSLRQEIRLLRELLNARSLPEFVAFKAIRKVQSATNAGPRTLARRTYRGMRRRAAVAKNRILSTRS